ncbi:response regulator [Sphingosinicella sp. LY1275]|uniref:response regulator n=1 Tax=Sphingosinicella sp. LY1275 TaxID=3095379 RepID=UPI002ADEB311|nr:response regulator [Sphingosinicella sp. LY1275]MEA1013993.1 response regulator [Sphingosinicella sp. LY1275]
MDNMGFSGARILVVEDEYYLADDLACAFERRGAEIAGPVATAAAADKLIAAGGIDYAVIDLNLRGSMAFTLGDRLREAGIPFLIASGYTRDSLPDRFREVPQIEKPFSVAQVLECMGVLVAAGKDGAGDA